MKKLFYITAVTAMLMTGCSGQDVKKFLLTDISENSDKAQTEDENVRQTNGVTFTQDDFAFYTAADDNGNGSLILGLGMTEESVDKTDEILSTYLPYLEIQYKEDAANPEKITIDENGKAVNPKRISYLNYTGSRKPVMTAKGIKTTGLLMSDGEDCSSVDEVIQFYGIDTDKEEYMVKTQDNNDDDYAIQLYFKKYVDEDAKQNEIKLYEKNSADSDSEDEDDTSDTQSTVTYYDRIVVDKGEKIPNDTAIDYTIRFIVHNDKIVGIQLYRY